MMTSLPLSVRTSSIHLVVCWNELTSVGDFRETGLIMKVNIRGLWGNPRIVDKKITHKKNKDKISEKKEGISKAQSASMATNASQELQIKSLTENNWEIHFYSRGQKWKLGGKKSTELQYLASCGWNAANNFILFCLYGLFVFLLQSAGSHLISSHFLCEFCE